METNSFACKWPNKEHSQQEVWGPLRHSKAWAWTEYPLTVKLQEFYISVFLIEIRDFFHFEDLIHSVGVPVSDPPECSFNVSLGSTDLN